MKRLKEDYISARVLRRRWIKGRQVTSDNPKERFAFAQKPLFLWFLSAIALGLVSFLFGNYSACRSSQVSDEAALQKYIAELRGREVVLEDALSTERGARARYLIVRSAMESESDYLFAENKGKRVSEIREGITSILKRWHQWLQPIQVDQALSKEIDADSKTYFVTHHFADHKGLTDVTSPVELQAYFDAFFTDFGNLQWLVKNTKAESYPTSPTPEPSLIFEPNEKEFEKRLSSYHTSIGGFDALSWTRILRPSYCSQRALWQF